MQLRRWIIFAVLAALLAAPSPVRAQSATPPYEADILKLSEILGALHYLRTLCGAEDGPAWRERMQALIKAENCAPDRCERLAGAFNAGYQGFSRNHKVCTPSAKAATQRFLAEGSRLADGINARNAN
ncbi:hypothetical protein GCM10007276_11420 [Agaricicola taiwanensis]|uniref:TIGR02301 family protein n=1 Tax=Agaricicola taiwanensis TaxID=591372 RepID=A0A8J2VQP1_9RHOB|nr:TIGR02301 family protein [Agaricicola taiwanensis]GGE35695.1 hypothetical protein GCM10007276_11420 [Agaricicola taiwanensis]